MPGAVDLEDAPAPARHVRAALHGVEAQDVSVDVLEVERLAAGARPAAGALADGMRQVRRRDAGAVEAAVEGRGAGQVEDARVDVVLREGQPPGQ